MIDSRMPLFVGSILCVLGMVLCGCSKTEAPPPPPPAPPPTPPTPKVSIQLPGEMQTLKAETEKGLAQIDAVMASLDGTVAAADADPRPAFQKFQKDLDALKAQAATIRSRADAMKARGKDYFKTWDEQLAQIATPEIKAAAAARKEELSKNYDAILESMAKTREGYDKYVGFLGDIAKVMENDLNPQGLKAIAPKVAQAKEEGSAVKANVNAVLAEIGKIAAIYSPGR